MLRYMFQLANVLKKFVQHFRNLNKFNYKIKCPPLLLLSKPDKYKMLFSFLKPPKFRSLYLIKKKQRLS